ncbi:TetR/AcrR family transcriptional regulator [Mangrovicoccus algicola]|uniref:TetR family transcriptional regulator n=1 Tax=Mangrovicoccus algicola TaxID=2771008 RepID=A0A8J6YUM6_9RHOB|nr:TetR family transcriptional regulator [Mangrovicoccus algicola]MBE3639573.1 TetR family transcriptional regulator [Mangrovicoccus algicola]
MDLTQDEKTPAKRAGWKRDPVKVQQDILQAATREFADNGFNGGRIERIVQLTRTSKRMIYYYFGDKEGLWQAVLEAAYTRVRAQEAELDLADLAPLEALRRLFVFTFDHHRQSADFIRLVMIENIRGGHVLASSGKIRDLNRPVVAMLEDICRRGAADGSLRADLCPLQLHWEVSALSFFNMSNRATFSGIFGAGLHDEAAQIRLRDSLADQLIRAVRA